MRLLHYIEQGGPIMYILLFLNVVGFALMIYKFYILSNEKNKVEERAENLRENLSQKIGTTTDPNIVIEMSNQEISTSMKQMEKGLNTIKIIASISPLLGLLGTVIGVLIAFQVMSRTGLNNPEHFAQGISMALITTVGGLIVAIPHYIGHNYMLGMLDSLENRLEKSLLAKIL
ncbi:MAG: MotA/TolQ/ExbB proton channel family protein [Bacteriovoracaceae bacterium]|nr:MotA/TolQ/ExbB proton channel family protein [Bacteriovoracaceae bacterium]